MAVPCGSGVCEPDYCEAYLPSCRRRGSTHIVSARCSHNTGNRNTGNRNNGDGGGGGGGIHPLAIMLPLLFCVALAAAFAHQPTRDAIREQCSGLRPGADQVKLREVTPHATEGMQLPGRASVVTTAEEDAAGSKFDK